MRAPPQGVARNIGRDPFAVDEPAPVLFDKANHANVIGIAAMSDDACHEADPALIAAVQQRWSGA
jgi:hypothetical protein